VSAPAIPPAAAEARTADLFAPGLRGLTLGLVLTITLAALELGPGSEAVIAR